MMATADPGNTNLPIDAHLSRRQALFSWHSLQVVRRDCHRTSVAVALRSARRRPLFCVARTISRTPKNALLLTAPVDPPPPETLVPPPTYRFYPPQYSSIFPPRR